MPLSLEVMQTALQAAVQAQNKAQAVGPRGGCGRVYVEFSDKIRKGSKIAKMITGAGFRMTERPYHTGSGRIYVGYDNATGLQWNRGELIAAAFRENGVECYVDGDGD